MHFNDVLLGLKKKSSVCKRIFERWVGLDIFRRRDGYHYVPDIYGKSSHKLIDIREDLLFCRAADKVIKTGKTYLYHDRLFNIYQGLLNVIAQNDRNETLTVLECGVFKGGCSYFMASLLSQLVGRNKFSLYAVDTFEGHSTLDIPKGGDGDHRAGHFSETNYSEVKEYLSDFQEVQVIKNRVQDCTANLEGIKFDFIHLDMDIYEPTIFSLEHFNKDLKTGGIIIIDDYNFRSCPGIKKAVDVFKQCSKNYVTIQLLTGQCLLVKLG